MSQEGSLSDGAISFVKSTILGSEEALYDFFNVDKFLFFWKTTKSVIDDLDSGKPFDNFELQYTAHYCRAATLFNGFSSIPSDKIMPKDITTNTSCALRYIIINDIAYCLENPRNEPSDLEKEQSIMKELALKLRHSLDEVKERCSSCNDLSDNEVIQKAKDFYNKFF